MRDLCTYLNEGFYTNVNAGVEQARKWLMNNAKPLLEKIRYSGSKNSLLADASIMQNIIKDWPDGFGISFESGVKHRYVIYKKGVDEFEYIVYKRTNSTTQESQLYNISYNSKDVVNIILEAFVRNTSKYINWALDSLKLTVGESIVNSN